MHLQYKIFKFYANSFFKISKFDYFCFYGYKITKFIIKYILTKIRFFSQFSKKFERTLSEN